MARSSKLWKIKAYFSIFLTKIFNTPTSGNEAKSAQAFYFLIFDLMIFIRFRFVIRFEVGARGGTRTPTPFGLRTSNVRVYQFHHPRKL